MYMMTKTLERDYDQYRVYNHLDQLILITTNRLLALRVFESLDLNRTHVRVLEAKHLKKTRVR